MTFILDNYIKYILAIGRNYKNFSQLYNSWIRQGYTIEFIDNIEIALKNLNSFSKKYDFIIIMDDRRYPNNLIDFISLIRLISYVIPLFVLSEDTNFMRKSKAIYLGADAYFLWSMQQTEEIKLQVESWLRKVNIASRYFGSSTKENDKAILSKGISINKTVRQIYKDEEIVPLTKQQYDLFVFLLSNNDRIISYEEIFLKVWKEIYSSDSNALIWQIISKLRKKLGKDIIQNVRGVGYKIGM